MFQGRIANCTSVWVASDSTNQQYEIALHSSGRNAATRRRSENRGWNGWGDEEHEIAGKINVPVPWLLLPGTSAKRTPSAQGNSPPYRQVALDANLSDR